MADGDLSAPPKLEQNASKEVNWSTIDEVEDLTTSLASQEEGKYDLLKHWRCAAHILNLVATSDAERAFSDINYMKANWSAFEKAVFLWNKQSKFLLILLVRGCKYLDRFIRLVLDIHIYRPNKKII